MSADGVMRHAQAWIRLNADDPEAVSAFGVIRHHLEAGRGLAGLRRFRLVEIAGALPERERLSDLLHRSTQFYNPHKERCMLRLAATEPAPAASNEMLVLVMERGGERRPAAERWWRHETGQEVEVREGVVWALAVEPGVDGAAVAEELAVVRGPAHGLLCNPNAQEHRVAGASPPLPWLPAGGR